MSELRRKILFVAKFNILFEKMEGVQNKIKRKGSRVLYMVRKLTSSDSFFRPQITQIYATAFKSSGKLLIQESNRC